MTKVEYFILEEAMSQPGKYIIRPNFDTFPEIRTSGSYSVLLARLMNLTYAHYLRFCRDAVGAELVGKNTLYPVAYFADNATVRAFVRLLINKDSRE